MRTWRDSGLWRSAFAGLLGLIALFALGESGYFLWHAFVNRSAPGSVLSGYWAPAAAFAIPGAVLLYHARAIFQGRPVGWRVRIDILVALFWLGALLFLGLLALDL
ncbi:MAG: hypothetical protein CMI01_00635 [Oceanospirillaceae bacterium]|nr:hypothetical protein [Oceanospirillaceae bacterium]